MAAHSHSPSAARVPHQAHALPSIAMADLHDELIHCRIGEDSHITIERHRERHRNIEGRNLKRDFESLSSTREPPVTRALCPLALQ
jgi:hypothetical protein